MVVTGDGRTASLNLGLTTAQWLAKSEFSRFSDEPLTDFFAQVCEKLSCQKSAFGNDGIDVRTHAVRVTEARVTSSLWQSELPGVFSRKEVFCDICLYQPSRWP